MLIDALRRALDIVGRDKTIIYNYYFNVEREIQPRSFNGKNPYLGLAAFSEDDADRFFGREKLVGELVERVDLRVDGGFARRRPQVGPHQDGAAGARPGQQARFPAIPQWELALLDLVPSACAVVVVGLARHGARRADHSL